MKGNKIGIFAIVAALASFQAVAAARLPSVSLERGPVSAKELFGVKTIMSKETPATASARSVTSRPAPRPIQQPQNNQSADVLLPRRPNSELWVSGQRQQGDFESRPPQQLPPTRPAAAPTAIRMPQAHEFVRLHDDFELPEESLLGTPAPRIARAATMPEVLPPDPLPVPIIRQAQVQQPTRVAQRPAVRPAHNRQAQLDNAIAKMIENKNNERAAARVAAPRPQPVREQVISAAPTPNVGATLTARTAEPSQDQRQRVLETKPVVRVAPREEFALKNPEPQNINQLSPRALKQAFQKAYISENRHLSTFSPMDDFDMASDNWEVTVREGFVGNQSINASAAQPRTLEIRMSFANNDSALTQDNFNILSEYAAMVANNPKRAIQISVSEDAVRNTDAKRLAARRLAIINQVLIDSGVHESRIIPVLSERTDGTFVLRIISTDQFQILRQTERDQFGDRRSQTTTRSMTW
ncbi:MAG: hypothetical protein FWD33_00630 [Alphaproteobacteria bacterium]|nr:hypothetical protein [Alphaproteobacteria bacterium]